MKKFERALFSKLQWHEVDQGEVHRVFRSDMPSLKRMMSGEEVPSPSGAGVVYRCVKTGEGSDTGDVNYHYICGCDSPSAIVCMRHGTVG